MLLCEPLAVVAPAAAAAHAAALFTRGDTGPPIRLRPSFDLRVLIPPRRWPRRRQMQSLGERAPPTSPRRPSLTPAARPAPPSSAFLPPSPASWQRTAEDYGVLWQKNILDGLLSKFRVSEFQSASCAVADDSQSPMPFVSNALRLCLLCFSSAACASAVRSLLKFMQYTAL